MPATGTLTARSTADLIALRDRLLAECLELENRLPAPQDERGEESEESSDPGMIRERIDEIHQELAMRDLAERVGVESRAAVPAPPSCDDVQTGIRAAEAARKSLEILEAIEMRSRFMDELAQAARAQGRLDQAAAFTLNAQKLDMERVEVLRQLSALALTQGNANEPAV